MQAGQTCRVCFVYHSEAPHLLYLGVAYRKEKASKVVFMLDFMNGKDGEEWTLGNRIKPHLNFEKLCIFFLILSFPCIFSSLLPRLAFKSKTSTYQSNYILMKNLKTPVLLRHLGGSVH